MSRKDQVWNYDYRRFLDLCSTADIQEQRARMLEQYAKLTKQWTVEVNSEWTCRLYFATKMILNATVLLNSKAFATNLGMRTANPYFEYYAAFSLMRGLVSTLPTESWQCGRIFEISHSKAINVAFDWLAKFNRVKAFELKKLSMQLKAQRELVAYRAPASGARSLGDNYDLEELLVLLAEAAQFNSEILEQSVEKNANPLVFEVLQEHISAVADVSIEGYQFIDREDLHRLDYVRRKIGRPYSLALFMTEGQTEDFIGSWDGDEDAGEVFSNGSPSNWQAIFDIP